MVKLFIDNKEVIVNENTSVLEAAKSIGTEIPNMCFLKGYSNHPSCLVCLVKDMNTGELFPSCAIQVSEGMEVITDDDEVIEARKDALELLLSDHVGDCEAPCRNGCPAFMNIPFMNRLIAQRKFGKALGIVKEEIALPLILGYVCQAPCEKVCRRKPIDNPVSICQIEKFVAALDSRGQEPFLPHKEEASNKKIAIIGGGPAGMSCAFYLQKMGHSCVIFDKQKTSGGSLCRLSENILPKEALASEIETLNRFGVEWILNTTVSAEDLVKKIHKDFDSIIIATGSLDSFHVQGTGINITDSGVFVNQETLETNMPGIFACGSVIIKQEMAVKVVAQAKKVAWSVNQFLQGHSSKKVLRMFNSKFGKLLPEEYQEYLVESIPDDHVIPTEGELDGFNIEEAVKEAERCMHCDCRKPHTCKLRIYSDEYGANQRKYKTSERKLIRKYFNHETIVYEPEKCIKCGLCVDITNNEKELTGLTFVGRGFDVKVNVPFSRSLDEALTKTAIKCAEECPTAAISLKNYNL